MNNIRRFSLLLLVLILTACSSQSAVSDYTVVAPASLKAGDAIPAPTGDAIMTVSGAISVKNSGDTLVLDMATLEKFGLVKYEVSDPWLNTKATYSGVLMSDFLKFVGASPSATTVKFTALDDYQVDIAISDIQKWPILLATQANGEYMGADNNGPTRIIFPYDTHSEIDQVAYKDLWVWNIKTVEIR